MSFASLERFFGKRPVHMITAGLIEDLKSWRRTAHGVRDVTLRHDLHALSKFFRYALKHNWCRANPVVEVEIPSDADAVRLYVLSPAEALRVHAASNRNDGLGSGSDYRHRQTERPHLGVQPTKIQ